MPDRTMICDKECLDADEYTLPPANCCHVVHQTEAKSFNFDVLPEITFELPLNEITKGKERKIYTRIMNFIALIREILLPRPQYNTDYGPNSYDSYPGVIYKSFGSTIQPMIWSHGDHPGNRDQQV